MNLKDPQVSLKGQVQVVDCWRHADCNLGTCDTDFGKILGTLENSHCDLGM